MRPGFLLDLFGPAAIFRIFCKSLNLYGVPDGI
jgi:hypothetical protein